MYKYNTIHICRVLVIHHFTGFVCFAHGTTVDNMN